MVMQFSRRVELVFHLEMSRIKTKDTALADGILFGAVTSLLDDAEGCHCAWLGTTGTVHA